MVCVYGTKYGHDPRQLRPPERCSSASRLSAASSLGPAATEHIFNSPSRCVAHHLEHWDFSRARSSAHQSFDGRSQSLLRKRGQRVCDVLSHDHRPGVVVAQHPLEPSQRACTSLCMHSPTSLGRLSPPEAWCPSQVRAIAGELRRTPVPPSVEPITVGRAGICRHIESQGQAARALRCSRALSRAGCLLAFAASLRSRRSSGGSGTAFLLCAPDAPCG